MCNIFFLAFVSTVNRSSQEFILETLKFFLSIFFLFILFDLTVVLFPSFSSFYFMKKINAIELTILKDLGLKLYNLVL